MKLYIQFVDGSGLIHELLAPPYCDGATITGFDDLPGGQVMRLSTAAGEARILLPPDYSVSWTISGYRKEA